MMSQPLLFTTLSSSSSSSQKRKPQEQRRHASSKPYKDAKLTQNDWTGTDTIGTSTPLFKTLVPTTNYHDEVFI